MWLWCVSVLVLFIVGGVCGGSDVLRCGLNSVIFVSVVILWLVCSLLSNGSSIIGML